MMDMMTVFKAPVPAPAANNPSQAVQAKKSTANGAGNKSGKPFGQALEAAKESVGNEPVGSTGTVEKNTQGIEAEGQQGAISSLAPNGDLAMAAIQSFFVLPLPAVSQSQPIPAGVPFSEPASAATPLLVTSTAAMTLEGLTAANGEQAQAGVPSAATIAVNAVPAGEVQQGGTVAATATTAIETAVQQPSGTVKKAPDFGVSLKEALAPLQSSAAAIKVVQQDTAAPLVAEAEATAVSQTDKQTAGNGQNLMADDQLGEMLQQQPEQASRHTSESPFAGILANADSSGKFSSVTGKESNAQLPPQPLNDPDNVVAQIVENARLISRQANTEMVIRLKPEHLGEMTLKVTVEGGVVSAAFHSNNSEVRSVIEASLPQLKQELSNQGLKVDNVGVYAGLGQFLSNDRRETAQQQPVIKFNSRKTDEDFVQAIEEQAVQPAGTAGETGVDYRI